MGSKSFAAFILGIVLIGSHHNLLQAAPALHDEEAYQSLQRYVMQRLYENTSAPFVYFQGSLQERNQIQKTFMVANMSYQNREDHQAEMCSADVLCMQNINSEEDLSALYEAARETYAHFLYFPANTQDPNGFAVASKYNLEQIDLNWLKANDVAFSFVDLTDSSDEGMSSVLSHTTDIFSWQCSNNASADLNAGVRIEWGSGDVQVKAFGSAELSDAQGNYGELKIEHNFSTDKGNVEAHIGRDYSEENQK